MLDDRRKMLKFRAWHGGFREIDLILGPFADAHVADLSAEELDAFEALMAMPDHDVYAWALGAAAPEAHEGVLMARLRAHVAAGGARPL